MTKKIPSFFILLLISEALLAQTPFIRNYSPEEYNAHSQNWSIVQDQRGVMYFANNNGVLEYDGANWRTIITPSRARYLSIDSIGVINVGLEGDFGNLQPDSIGRLHYFSLKDKLPSEYHDFTGSLRTVVIESKRIFRSSRELFLLQNDSIEIIHSDNDLLIPFVVRNRFYIQKEGEGLFYLESNSLHLIPGSKEYFYNKNIMAMLPSKSGDIIIVTHKQGIYMYNPNKLPSFWKPKGFEAVDDFILKNKILSGTILHNGCFAIGSIGDGVLVFDKQGKIKNHYNKQNGLQSNCTYSLFMDKYGQLWVTLEEGISLVMNNLPFTNYTEMDGLEGPVYCIQKFNHKLYVGTSSNLYMQNKENKFERIDGTIGQNFFLLKANGKLLLGNHPNGIFDINDNQALQSNSLKNITPVAAIRLNKYPNYIITQLWGQGLAIIEYKNERWEFKHLIKGFDKNARYIEEDNQGNFWANASRQLYKFRLNETLDSVISLQDFPPEQYRLPENSALPFRLSNGEVVFCSNKGIYRYFPDKDSFEQHPDFPMFTENINNLKQGSGDYICFEEFKGNNISEKGVLRSFNGKYEMDKTPFLKFTDLVTPNTYSLYPYSDSLLYFGTNKGLLEYHPKQKVNYDIPFNTLIRKIFATDSLIYGGYTNNSFSIDDPVVFKYRDNNLFFHYAATFYEDAEKNLFSYRLIGSSDTAWSAWTKDHKKEYTNLHEGKYIFEVKSQNIYQKYGHKASFAFAVLPPWQRTFWAYALYGIFAIGFIWLLIRLNSVRLKRLNETLKQTVKERTADILKQKEDIESQAKELKKVNEKLIELDNFKEGMTGMIVHDLKNPLTTIIGLSEKEEIQQAGKQMLNMVLNILDVQKFEDSKVKLQLTTFHASEVINDSLKQVQLLLNRKSIAVKTKIDPIANLHADLEIINRVIVNILTNAIKYTPNNGSITINAEPEKNSEFVRISVTDTGKGIPKNNLNSVFDKFSQVEAKKSGEAASTGLGLAFCKLAVEEHGGEIGVTSEPGQTTFWFLIPKVTKDVVEVVDIDNISINDLDSVGTQLTDTDIEYLNPYIEELKKFTVYEFSDIIAILNKIETTDNKQRIQYWRIKVENAVRACNEIKYNELLKMKNDV